MHTLHFESVVAVLIQEHGHQLPCLALAFGEKSFVTVVATLFRGGGGGGGEWVSTAVLHFERL